MIQGSCITLVEIREYASTAGNKPLITAYIRTEKHGIEMTYQHGYIHNETLQDVASLLTNMLGVSALVTRAQLALQEHIHDV